MSAIIGTLPRLDRMNEIAKDGVGDLFEGALYRLFKDDLVINDDTLISTLVASEADYTGYSAISLTIEGTGIDEGKRAQMLCNNAFFQPSGTAIGNTIYGAFISNTGGALLAVSKFASPQAMQGPSDVVALTYRENYPPANSTIILLES